MTVIHETDRAEWEALDKIREALDGLPSGSYVKAAFDGACGMAEDNIKGGAFGSLKALAAFWEKEARRWEEASNNNISGLLNAHEQVAALEKALAEERNALACANEKNTALMEKRTFSDRCVTEIRAIIRAQVDLTNAAITAAAVALADAAGDPESEAFLTARRAYRERREYMETLEQVQAEIGE